MEIVGPDFKLILNKDSNHFDLEILKTISPKGKEQRDEFKNVGYNMPIIRAILLIIHSRIDRDVEGEITMNEYFNLFKKYQNEIINTIENEKYKIN